MVRPSLIQLQILDSTYTEDLNGNREFTIKIKFDTNFTERNWFEFYVQKNPTTYLQLETLDGIKTSISQKDITIKWKKVVRGQAIYPINEFSFQVTGKENLPNNIMIGTVYMWTDGQAVSYSISTKKTLESQISQANVPESASIGFDNPTSNSVYVFWQPNKTGGSPILSYGLTVKNEDTGQTILQKTLTDTRIKVENLQSNTNYKAYVFVTNAIGNSFEQSYGFKTLEATSPPPPPPPPPPPVITYCVNVYTLDSGGNVLSDHYDAINITKFQQLTNEGKYVFLCEDGIIPTEQQVRNFYGYTAPVTDSSINSTMVSQLIGTFILKDGRVKGQIMYITNEAQYNNNNKLISGFNPFYYSEIKNLISLVQIKSKSGVPIAVKPNGLNFTQTEKDEIIHIDEAVGNFKEIIIDFFVWKSPSDMRAFAENKQIQVVETPPDEPEPCEIGFHKDFSGKCVSDNPPGELPRDKLIDTLKGFLFGTVALSLLARKY